MYARRSLKSYLDPHTNTGNAVHFKLKNRVQDRNAQSLVENFLFDLPAARNLTDSLSQSQVDLLNKHLPVASDYFLSLVQNNEISDLHSIEKALSFLPEYHGKSANWFDNQNFQFYFGQEFQRFYNTYLAPKITASFVITLMALIDCRAALGLDIHDAFEILRGVNAAGMAQISAFVKTLKDETITQVLTDKYVDARDILEGEVSLSFIHIPGKVKAALITPAFLARISTADTALSNFRLDRVLHGNFNELNDTEKLAQRISTLKMFNAQQIFAFPETFTQLKEKLFIFVQTHFGRHTTNYIAEMTRITGFNRDQCYFLISGPMNEAIIRKLTTLSDGYAIDSHGERHFGSIEHPSHMDNYAPYCMPIVRFNQRLMLKEFERRAQGLEIRQPKYIPLPKVDAYCPTTAEIEAAQPFDVNEFVADYRLHFYAASIALLALYLLLVKLTQRARNGYAQVSQIDTQDIRAVAAIEAEKKSDDEELSQGEDSSDDEELSQGEDSSDDEDLAPNAYRFGCSRRRI